MVSVTLCTLKKLKLSYFLWSCLQNVKSLRYRRNGIFCFDLTKFLVLGFGGVFFILVGFCLVGVFFYLFFFRKSWIENMKATVHKM